VRERVRRRCLNRSSGRQSDGRPNSCRNIQWRSQRRSKCECRRNFDRNRGMSGWMGRRTRGRGKDWMVTCILKLDDGDRVKVARRPMRLGGRDWTSRRENEQVCKWREPVWSLRTLEGKILFAETLEMEDLAERAQRNSATESACYVALALVGVRTIIVASPAGLEPATLCLEGRCSIHLSYGLSFACDSNSAVESLPLISQ
jgi:hypothetical protein